MSDGMSEQVVSERVGDEPGARPSSAGPPVDLTIDADPALELERPRLPRDSWPARAARRVVQRPRRWIEAPWTVERIVTVLTTVVVVGAATFFAIQVVHPGLVLRDNTPTGGDMGAHVMGPAYLRDHLLPHFQLSGWSNYWYDGFPMYRFYMVIPALMIVALDVVLPYGVAFKIIAVLGIVTLPLCCWMFGRLARFRYPMPELMALAGLLFLFDESFSIYGGNVKSTMAGEFSFSIALSFAILGLGLFAKGLETGKYRSWATMVLSLAILSHGIVAIFVGVGVLLLWLVWMDRSRLVYGLMVGVATALLSAFWVLPFVTNHAYMTDMKYGFRPDGATDSFWKMFFPLHWSFDVIITSFAVIGFIGCVVRRHLTGAWLGICTLAMVGLVYVTRDSLPVIGLLWNPRLLPFVYLLRYLMMMIGIVETVQFVVRGSAALRSTKERPELWTGLATAAVVALSVLVVQLFHFREMPGASITTHNGKQVYQWGPISLPSTSSRALSDAWSRYNFLGYEGRPTYGEYKALVDTMAALGDDPAHGCGRALWENNGDTGKYGTTMALMLLPHWTDGCIASSEGLFFEASGTTPYHFITAAAMSASSSNPVRELRYENNNAEIGVKYMQDLGLRYLMVFTEAAKTEAAAQPDLSLVATSGPWKIYEVAGSDLVQPLAMQPVVVNHREGDQRERNLELGTSWFQHSDEWAAIPADDGPATWQRIDVDVDVTRQEGLKTGDPGRRVDIVVPREPIEAVPLPAVNVSNIQLGDQDLRFSVDQIGVPVLVKMSYFPNWKVEGAQGPYRIAPNLMVVVPTQQDVHLTYGRTSLDYVAYLLTFGGIVLLVFFRWRGDFRHRTPHPFAERPFTARPDLAMSPVTAPEVELVGWDPVPPRQPARGPDDETLLEGMSRFDQVIEHPAGEAAPPRTPFSSPPLSGAPTWAADAGPDDSPPGAADESHG